jgi:uncharacterized protein (TIGR02147 family)
LRSFARDLGFSPARLSDVLRGRYGLSLAAAQTVASRLGMNSKERQHFCDLVESKHARSKANREAAQRRLDSAQTYQQLTMDTFAVIADWYHYAILELTLLKNFQSDVKWIAHQLGINSIVVSAAIERLKRLDLIVQIEGQ